MKPKELFRCDLFGAGISPYPGRGTDKKKKNRTHGAMADAAGRRIAGPPLPSSLTSRVGVGRDEEGGEWKGWQNPLHEAVWTNNSEQLRQLVRKSFGPVQGGQNQRVGLDDEENQFTALYVASLKNDINSACVLLEAGASVDNGGAQGTPPLFSAAAKGNLELVTSPKNCIRFPPLYLSARLPSPYFSLRDLHFLVNSHVTLFFSGPVVCGIQM